MKLEKLINTGIPILCGVVLIVIVALPFLQLVLRNCFSSVIIWSDEVSQFCMTWLVLFGSIWATKNNRHLNTGLKLHKKLNIRLVLLIDCILDLALIVVGAVAAYHTAIFTLKAWGIESLSLRWLKIGYVVAVVPVAMFGLCYYSLKSFLKNLAGILNSVSEVQSEE